MTTNGMLTIPMDGDNLEGDLTLPDIGMDDFFPDNQNAGAVQTSLTSTTASGMAGIVEETTMSGQVTAMELDSGVIEESGTLDDIVIPSLGGDDVAINGNAGAQPQANQIIEQSGVVAMEEDQLDENGEKIPIYLDLSRMEQWRVQDVCEYLKNSVFGTIYVDSFFQQKISGRILYGVDDASLTRFGVKSAIHRFRILRDIADAKDIARWEQCTQQGGDGGTTLSRFMRFNSDDIAMWCSYVTRQDEIGMSIQRYNPNLTGYDMMHAQEIHSLLASLCIVSSDQGKLVAELNRLRALNDNSLQTVEQVWKQRRNPADRCYYLKPQHLVTPSFGQTNGSSATVNSYQQPAMRQSTSKPAMGVKTNRPKNKLIGQKRKLQQTQSSGTYDHSNVTGVTSNYTGPNVLEWDNATVLAFVSGFQFGDRYLRHFRSLQIDGPTLIRLTANTLENVVRVTVKTHIRQMCKAIDELRDMALEEFVSRPSTQAWMANNPKRQRTSGGAPSKRPRRSQTESSASSSSLHAVQQSLNAQSDQSQSRMAMGNTPGGYAQVGVGGMNGNSQVPVPACQLCGLTENIMRCSNCKNAFYCSREHQLKDWPSHQAQCVA